ncbi:MAG TPA: hypothetical protein VK192_09070, partial [Sphingomicrobium sp.]|nr:hypothetical protein [Sphingomicrobium sp.]
MDTVRRRSHPRHRVRRARQESSRLRSPSEEPVFGRSAKPAAPYSLPALRYSLDALEPLLSADTLELHYHKHHAAYEKGANDA